jgi:prepilin-type N-terminal cleavage/methylation domain-containing protein
LVRDDRGFTLIEMIAVMIIIAVFASIMIVRFDAFGNRAKQQAIKLSIAELNEREKLTWNNAKAGMSYVDDITLFAEMQADNLFDLGEATSWNGGPDSTGGTLNTNAGSAHLTRIPSTFAEPGHWH